LKNIWYGSSSTNSSKGIPDRVDIGERPEIINNRQRVGDWEGDTVKCLIKINDIKVGLKIAV
jgi:IS30 family transposase